ncbi:chemotaxis protein [Desulfovibrio sp. OttesenSCG-928-M14]|nr:chemotaxis protein [Desulfovibrio sp. OttesenSCG-928-M14]MDL2291101.1 chemotaxis protein [Desulfovibrio sp. OttesenSCG-928-F20]
MSQTNILLEAGTNELEIVEFYLDEVESTGAPYKGYYGVNVAKVLEIIRLPKVTELPEVRDPSVLGAFNLRSHVIPLVDLSLWLGKARRPDETDAKVIVTEFNNVTTAFMVSGVNRIHRISWEEVDPPNNYVSSLTNNTITGVVKLEGRIIFLLDLERIVGALNPQLALRLDEAIDWKSGGRYRALVADDSTVIREMLKDLLQRANFEVEAVNNGKEAWLRLEEIRNKCGEEGQPIESYLQCIVSDIEMPQMDGHNLCKRIKEDPVLKRLPVILFSSLITDKLRHKGDAVGADDQISKPEVTHLAQRALTLIKDKGFGEVSK